MGKRRSNIRDVAAAANVSPSAVSLVIRGKPGVGAETRERVWAAVSELGYELPSPAPAARSLAVCLLIEKGAMPVLLDLFYGDIIRGFQAEAQRLGYQVLLHMYDSSADTPALLMQGLPDEARGLVVANDGDIRPDLILELQELQLPLVLIENHTANHRIDCVLGDNFEAGYVVTRHLIDLGHRALAILPGPTKYSSLVERLRGSLAAVAEARVDIPPELMPDPVSGQPMKGYLQMREVLRSTHRPTAVVAVSDKTAFGAMEAIKEAGLRIPDDIALVGIDDVAESAFSHPPLTTFRIPRHEMGVIAMRKLRHLIDGDGEPPAKTIVYGDLVIRESTGAPSL
ncbi:MAG TPA: LacI family DNA-binding transcriptional regulator [Thermomicrobiales bacterium]|nr:LacI family DNA-binding transcriptional regulator [Thermomicrobiales bacterium]